MGAATVAAGGADPGSLLLLVGAAVGACVLWGLVVFVHQRRQSRVDLVALEAKLQAKRAKKAGLQVSGSTDRELDASQRAWSRTNEGRPSGLQSPE